MGVRRFRPRACSSPNPDPDPICNYMTITTAMFHRYNSDPDPICNYMTITTAMFHRYNHDPDPICNYMTITTAMFHRYNHDPDPICNCNLMPLAVQVDRFNGFAESGKVKGHERSYLLVSVCA